MADEEIELVSVDELDAITDDIREFIDTEMMSIVDDATAQALEENPDNIQAFLTTLGIAIQTAWTAFVAGPLTARLTSIFNNAADQDRAIVEEILGRPIDQRADTSRYIDVVANRMVGVSDIVFDAIRDDLISAVEEGQSIPAAAANIDESTQIGLDRAATTARTELNGARNGIGARTMQTVAAGFPPGTIMRRWRATLDDRTRETHRRADGQVVAVDEPFQVGRSELRWPADPSGPAGETVNCRCSVGIVIRDNAEPTGGTVEFPETVTAAAPGGTIMPWYITDSHEDCADWAVVKTGDDTVQGCTDNREDAVEMLRALHASEEIREDTPVVMDDGQTVDMQVRPLESWQHPITGTVCFEGEQSSTRDIIAPGAATWLDQEIPIGYQYERTHGGTSTDKVANVGAFTRLWRDGTAIKGEGFIDTRSPYADQILRELPHMDGTPGYGGWVSIDADRANPSTTNVEYIWPDECHENYECGLGVVAVQHDMRIRAVTIVQIPAFPHARIMSETKPPVGPANSEPDDEATPPAGESTGGSLLAAAYTITIEDLPPIAWFEEPQEQPAIGGITIEDTGRIYGYVAPKHIAHRGQQQRVEVPTGNVDYTAWQSRTTMVDVAGTPTALETGVLTADCGHASTTNADTSVAMEHYENTCSIVATARIGENDYGVWIAGALHPGVTEDQVATMMAAQLSGDWRPHREVPGAREFAGALFVPVPGFAARTQTQDDYGLVASAGSVKFEDGELSSATAKVTFTETIEAPRGELHDLPADLQVFAMKQEVLLWAVLAAAKKHVNGRRRLVVPASRKFFAPNHQGLSQIGKKSNKKARSCSARLFPVVSTL